MMGPMSDLATASDQGPALLALYDRALPEVYGYLVRRCDGTAVAEDLTAELGEAEEETLDEEE